MLFRAFRVVYTIKELDSHAKHGQSWKKKSVSVPKISLPGSYKFQRVFSIVALADVNDGETPYMGISPGRTHPCTHRQERESLAVWSRRESESAAINVLHSAALHGTRSGRMSLKKCVFGCEGKITLFGFPNVPSITWTVDTVCSFSGATKFLKCFVDERFINKAQ